MKVVYSGEHEVEVPALGLIVKPGESVEVSEDAVEGLVHQAHWALVKEPKPTVKAAKATENKEV